MTLRARRTSEHMALAFFVGVILFFVQSFVVTEHLIPNEIARKLVLLVTSALRLGIPAIFFVYMQKNAGFEERKITRPTGNSVKYNVTLAFACFAIIFIFGIFYSVAFPMSASRYSDKGIISSLLTVLVSAVVPAVFEEYLYRKLCCRELTVHGNAFAVIISSLLFALAHFSFSAFPYAFVCGILLGFVYLKTGSVKYSVAIHFANNFLGYILAMVGSRMNVNECMNMMIIIIVALGVMLLGAFYTLAPHKDKFASCENGNVASSTFLTFPMVVYIFCTVLMNFI